MLKAIRNLDYVILLCEEIESMRHFYHEVLGFPIYRDEATGRDRWIEMRVGAVLLTLRYRGRPYDGPDLPGSAKIQLAFRVTPSEVDTCYTELMSQGVEILEAPRRQDWGHKTLFFKDPEGNILEIYADI